MDDTTLISIIVPIYNVEKYLKECIESILNQTYKNFELILVDDGSTDSCPTICDTYATKDTRIRVIHKQNGGATSARKAGANIAKGEYIVAVDGDDWVTKNYLIKMYKQIEQYSPDVILFGYTEQYENKAIKIKPSVKEALYNRVQIQTDLFPILIFDEFGKHISYGISLKAYKRKLYVKYQNRVDSSIKIGEDTVCIQPIIFNAHSIAVIHDCLYYYRQNSESIMHSTKVLNTVELKNRIKTIEKSIDFNMFDFKDQLYRYIAHDLFSICASQFNRPESYKTIKHDILNSLNDPYFINAIKKCKYNKKYLKGQLALFALKYRCCLLMKFYCLYFNMIKNKGGNYE